MVMRVPFGTNGQFVPVSPQINSPSYLLPGRDCWPLLREALAEIEPEEVLEGYVVTIEGLSRSTPLTVIKNTHPDRVFWAVYRGHKAAAPQPSPFINTQEKWPESTSLTLDFKQGWLVQVIPGDHEVPPLPWMSSAADFHEGVDACVAFWREHSLLYSNNNTLPNSRSFDPPSWWRNAA